ncbi:MAG TPA: hypothetical protein VIH26_10095 [Anaerolineales bacterium]
MLVWKSEYDEEPFGIVCADQNGHLAQLEAKPGKVLSSVDKVVDSQGGVAGQQASELVSRQARTLASENT